MTFQRAEELARHPARMTAAEEEHVPHCPRCKPLLETCGALIAIIGLSGPTFRLGRAKRRGLLAAVQAAATEIEGALGQLD